MALQTDSEEFKSTQELIDAGRRYLTVRESQLHKAQRDASEYPTPTKMAQLLGLPLTVIVELGTFAMEELGDVEREHIESQVDGRIDYNTGELIREV